MTGGFGDATCDHEVVGVGVQMYKRQARKQKRHRNPDFICEELVDDFYLCCQSPCSLVFRVFLSAGFVVLTMPYRLERSF